MIPEIEVKVRMHQFSRHMYRPRAALGALVATLALGFAPRVSGQGAPSLLPLAGPDSMWKGKKNLRVCADPDNMPFTSEKRTGFDDRVAALIARELGDSVSYAWWPSRRGYVRNTLAAGACDIVLGVPKGFDPVATSKPYYRSTYYFVYRADRHLNIRSLDDPQLKKLRIGVNLIGEDYTNTPPAHALTQHGIERAEGFSTFYGEEHRPGEIVDSVASGGIDVAIVWGPLAGYFAARERVPLTLVPLPDEDSPDLPFAYDITIGTRRSDRELRARIDEILEQRKSEIDQILKEYNVPVLPIPAREAGTDHGS